MTPTIGPKVWIREIPDRLGPHNPLFIREETQHMALFLLICGPYFISWLFILIMSQMRQKNNLLVVV